VKSENAKQMSLGASWHSTVDICLYLYTVALVAVVCWQWQCTDPGVCKRQHSIFRWRWALPCCYWSQRSYVCRWQW